MPAKNDNITKNPSAAGKKGGKVPGKQTRTIIKERLEKIGLTWDDAESLVEVNILEFMNAKDKKTRQWATRYLAEFAKPKKKEISGKVGLTVDKFIEDDL